MKYKEYRVWNFKFESNDKNTKTKFHGMVTL